jgi:predicted nuclease with TOPRIM domain
MSVEAVPDDELLTIISEVKAGRGRVEHIAPVAAVAVIVRGNLDKIHENQTKIVQSLQRLEQGQAGLEGRMDSLEGRMGSLEGRMGSLEGRMDSLETKVTDGFATMEKTLVAHLTVFSTRVLDGVKSQLEEHKIPISVAERRGYQI